MRRRAFACAAVAAALGLDGCATGDVRVVPQPQPDGNALLSFWMSIDGGWRLEPSRPMQVAPVAGPRLRFLQPVGVAAQGDVLLVADAAARTVWRVIRSRDAMSAFAPFTGGGAEQGASLQLGNDLSAWVASPADHTVIQYDANGRVIRSWRDEANAMRPVAIAVPQDRSELLVGDAAAAQVVVFDPLGRARGLLSGNRPSALQSITAMCLGPGGLYVLDRAAQQVVVLGPHGEVMEIVGEHQLVQPRALAVDRSGRVFVSDDLDQRIKVFRGTRLLAAVGGIGSGPMRFGRIESLAVDGNLLYAADSLNGRVQVMLVAPPSMEPREPTP